MDLNCSRTGRCPLSSVRRFQCALVLLVIFWPGVDRLPAQPSAPGTGSTFVAGSRELYSLDLSQTPIGAKPTGIESTGYPSSGALAVDEKDGQRTLRSKSKSEFVVTLRERLPERFTLEIDLHPQTSFYFWTEEFGVEGTPVATGGPGSAYIAWHHSNVKIDGGRPGGGATNAAMPENLKADMLGQLAEIRMSFDGPNFRLYTNGQELISLPDLRFVRGRMMRVVLGGMEGANLDVHLVRLRVAALDGAATTVAQQQNPIMSTTPTTNSTPSGSGALALTGLTVTAVPGGGAFVRWNPLPVAATYFVVRWNVNDPICCNAMSPPGLPLTQPGWQDSFLPLAGTYGYRVIAKTASGLIAGETQFSYGGATGTVAGTTSPAPIPSNTTPTLSTTPAPTTTTTTVATPTSTPIAVPTSAGAIASGPLLTSAPAPTATTTVSPPTVTAVPVATTGITTTGTITPIRTGTSTPTTTDGSGGGGAPASDPANPANTAAAQYRVVLTGATSVRQTADDPLNLDGRGDEVYGAAVVLVLDRKLNQQRSIAFAFSKTYGDTGLILPFPNRVRAGNISQQGGIGPGDRVPSEYDPAGTSIPPPSHDQLPLLIWEGPLTAGVEAVVVVPSLWSNNLKPPAFATYKLGWTNVSPAVVLGSATVKQQYNAGAPSPALVPIGDTIQPIPGISFAGGSDRPIGMGYSQPLVTRYQERVLVLTRENLAAVTAGSGVTVTIPLGEPPDILLGGNYMLHLRIERTN